MMRSAVLMSAATMALSVIFMTIVRPFAMPLAVNGNEDSAVPPVIHKKDRPVAGLITAAILSPAFGMSRGNTQIDRFIFDYVPVHDDRFAVNHSRLRIGVIANIHVSIESRLTDSD